MRKKESLGYSIQRSVRIDDIKAHSSEWHEVRLKVGESVEILDANQQPMDEVRIYVKCSQKHLSEDVRKELRSFLGEELGEVAIMRIYTLNDLRALQIALDARQP